MDPGLPPRPRRLHLLASLVKEEENERSQVVSVSSAAPERVCSSEFYDLDKEQVYKEDDDPSCADSELDSQVVKGNTSVGFKGKKLKKSRSQSSSSDGMKQKTKNSDQLSFADNKNKSNQLNNHSKNGHSMVPVKGQLPSSSKCQRLSSVKSQRPSSVKAERPSSSKGQRSSAEIQRSSSAKGQRPVSPDSYSSDTYSSDNEYIKNEKYRGDSDRSTPTKNSQQENDDKDKQRKELRDSRSQSSSDSYTSNDTGKGKEMNGHSSTRKSRARDNGMPRNRSNSENSDIIDDDYSSSSFSSCDEKSKSISSCAAASKPPKHFKRSKPLLSRKKHLKCIIYQIDPDLYLEGKLQQKYSELEELMACSFVDQQSHVTRHHIYQMGLLHNQYRNTSHGFPATTIIIPHSLPADVRNKSQQSLKRSIAINSDVNQESCENTYGTLRRVMAVENVRKTIKIMTDNNAGAPFGGKPKAKKKKKPEATLKKTINYSEEETSEQPSRSSKSSTKSKASSPSRSPHAKAPIIDDHIKYSNNEILKQWLRQKDKLYRQHIREEKRKKRQERELKIEEANKKFTDKLISEEIVKEWMKEKNKELVRKHKEDNRQMKETTERMKRKSHNLPGDTLQIIPNSPSSKQTNDIKIDKRLLKGDETPDFIRDQINKKRETEEENKLANLAHDSTPHPHQTKLIYKRPVAGKIKLKMEVRGKSPTPVKNKEIKDDKSVAESNTGKQMRLSYDEWIKRKREFDALKNKNAERQKELAKSDPELERVIPALGRKRIEDKLNARKRIDTGIKKFDDKANKSFGGADFGGEKEGNLHEQPKTSYRLREKEAGLLITLKQIQRPFSAQTAIGNVPHPKISTKSPRQAVIPQQVDKVIANDNRENPYQLSFPPEQGLPSYVADNQHRIFMDTVPRNIDESEQRNFLNSKLVKDGLQDIDDIYEAHKMNPSFEEAKIKSDAKCEVDNIIPKPELPKITDIMYSPQHDSSDSSSYESQKSDNFNDILQANSSNSDENSAKANFEKNENKVDVEKTKYDFNETVNTKAHSHYKTYENLNELSLESPIVVYKNEDKLCSNIEQLQEKVESLKVDTATLPYSNNGIMFDDTNDTLEDDEQITETAPVIVLTETDSNLVGILKDSKRNDMIPMSDASGEPLLSESMKTANKIYSDQVMSLSDELSNSRKKVSFNEQTEVFESFESSSTDTVTPNQDEFATETESLDTQEYFMDDEFESEENDDGSFNKFDVKGEKLTINITDIDHGPTVTKTEKADKDDIEDKNGDNVIDSEDRNGDNVVDFEDRNGDDVIDIEDKNNDFAAEISAFITSERDSAEAM